MKTLCQKAHVSGGSEHARLMTLKYAKRMETGEDAVMAERLGQDSGSVAGELGLEPRSVVVATRKLSPSWNSCASLSGRAQGFSCWKAQWKCEKETC